MRVAGVAWFQTPGHSRSFDDHHALDDDPDELDENLRAPVDQQVGLLSLGGDASLLSRLSEDEAASIAEDE